MTVSNGAVQALSLLVAAVPTNTARGTFTMLGGSFNLSSNLVLGDASISTGQVVIAGGDLSINNANNSGMLTIPSGTFDLSGGNVTADNILLTNSAGRLIFNSGTLHSRNTTVSNAMPFVIGDGTNAATFQLLGGTHYFADGLIISSNATLSGCGTIIGTIINQGTIATNCAAVPPSITQQPVSLIVTQGATAMFSVVAAGDPPLHYQWRFSGLMANIPGATNSTLVIPDAQKTNAGNYRVIVSNASSSIMSAIATLRVLIPSTIVSTTLLGTNFDFSFSTVSNLNYTIEYKTNLSNATWTPLRTVTGTGALFPFSDAVMAVTNRFYRVRVE